MKSLLIIVLLITPAILFAQRKVFVTDDGAIRGYDPVAYFTDKKPVKGDKTFSLNWNDATWYFKSKENLEKFKASPEKYAPQFGGFCAYGVSRDYKVKTEPEAWSIVNNKLYLNYDLEVQKEWNKDQPGYIKKAEANWAKLKDN
jgi:YHS domain-containing protein